MSEHFVVGAITDNCAVSGETDGELASPSTNSVSEVYTPAVSGDPESTTPPSRSSDCDGRRNVWDFYPTGVLDPALADSARSPSASKVNDMLGLGPIATDAITGWAMHRKGRALWQVGERSYKVETHLHPIEQHLTWTNDAIQGAA